MKTARLQALLMADTHCTFSQHWWTGLSRLAPELSGKQLEILKETIPKLSRAAVLGGSTLPVDSQILREIELAAAALGVKIQHVPLPEPRDIEPAFRTARKGQADAVL